MNFLRSLTKSPLKTRLLARLYTSFWVLVLLVVVDQCLGLWIGALNQLAVSWVSDTLLVQSEGERLLGAALDEETGLRGYLITKNRASLEPYWKGQTAFKSSLNRLYALLQDNPGQLQLLDQIEAVHDRWQSQFAQKALSGVSTSTLAGKTLFDPLRTQVRTLLRREEMLLDERQQRLYKLNQIKTVADILSIVAIAAGVCWNLWLLHRRVEVPLSQLTKVGEAWRAGEMEVRFNYSSSDEIGRLAQVLNTMAEEIRDRQKCTQVRSQQLEELIAALSHDLRTPLLASRASLRPMLNGAFGPVSDTLRDVLEEYRGANEDLLKLVEALLNVSRYQATGGKHMRWEPLNWEKIFVQATTQISAISERKCAITCKISPSLPTVKGDELEIQRVVQNLLDNAVRVSEPNKQIILEVTTFGDAQVKVSVRDNGPGIAPHEKERLFHSFIQGRNRRGEAGLGLYLCRQIVEAHGGTINVESTLGAGSTFWFTIPVATNRAGSEHKKEMYNRRNDV